jgi:hypothetical protein
MSDLNIFKESMILFGVLCLLVPLRHVSIIYGLITCSVIDMFRYFVLNGYLQTTRAYIQISIELPLYKKNQDPS